MSGGRRRNLASLAANALDHRAQPIRALAGDVLPEPQVLEHLERVRVQDGLRLLPGIQRDQEGDEPFGNMRVAVGLEVQHGPGPAARHVDVEPDLALAAGHKLMVAMRLGGQRRQHAPELHHVLELLVPLLEELEIGQDIVDGRQHNARTWVARRYRASRQGWGPAATRLRAWPAAYERVSARPCRALRREEPGGRARGRPTAGCGPPARQWHLARRRGSPQPSARLPAGWEWARAGVRARARRWCRPREHPPASATSSVRPFACSILSAEIMNYSTIHCRT